MIHYAYLVTPDAPPPGCGLGSIAMLLLAVGLVVLLLYGLVAG